MKFIKVISAFSIDLSGCVLGRGGNGPVGSIGADNRIITRSWLWYRVTGASDVRLMS